MSQHPRAGQPAQPADLVDIPALLRAYEDVRPDPSDPTQRVAFGTSGHRGSAFKAAFNEAHILATTEAICRYRASQGYTGPLFIGRDTHALSEPAWRTALEVLVANGIDVRVDALDGYTPTPAVSHAILVANRGRHLAGGAAAGLADGIVVTPSHNPPDDGGFKYNPPNGGPADTDVTRWIQDEANRILEATGSDGLDGVPRLPFEHARAQAIAYDFLARYVDDLGSVVDMAAIADSGLRIGVDPLGGAAVDYWGVIGEHYGLDLTVTNDTVDPAFGFMPLDWDGRIRMDPSSPFAMARLVELRDGFDLALGNDADADRHGVVVPGVGLMNPNHVLAAAISYLFGGGRDWATRSRSARRSSARRSSTGSSRTSAGGCSRSRSGSSGSSTGSSTVRWDLAGRRAPGRHSCAATAPSGRRQGRDHRVPAGGGAHREAAPQPVRGLRG